MSMNQPNNAENNLQEEEILENTTSETVDVPELSEDEIKLAKTTAELADMKDKFIRLQAEFDNFRKRTAKEKLDLISTAEEKLMLSILTVADDMDRATPSMQSATDVQVLKEGIEIVFSKFRKTLESKGLKALETKGTDFNPDLHEAITQIPAPTPDLKNKIVDEIEKGYYLNDKLIRVAKVIIGN